MFNILTSGFQSLPVNAMWANGNKTVTDLLNISEEETLKYVESKKFCQFHTLAQAEETRRVQWLCRYR